MPCHFFAWRQKKASVIFFPEYTFCHILSGIWAVKFPHGISSGKFFDIILHGRCYIGNMTCNIPERNMTLHCNIPDRSITIECQSRGRNMTIDQNDFRYILKYENTNI